MSLNSAKNITRKSWNIILIPDTVISLVKKLACNEPNHFIFTDLSSHPIGDIEITRVYRDASDSNKKQSPQEPTH